MKRFPHMRTLPGLGLAALLLSSGCTMEKTDEVSEFREAIPSAESVKVSGPEGSASASGSRTTSQTPGMRALTDTPISPWARWYGFTREVRDGVNVVTAAVLGSVWYIVHTEPTAIEHEEAIWGPYTDALEPVTWRFRVTRVATAEYDYVLEGRPKASSLDADYVVVLKGKGFGRRHPQHADGEFTIDMNAARALDPIKHQNESGTVRIIHDLPAEITEVAGALPRTITAELRATPGAEWLTITSYALADHTGRLDVDGHVDVDDSKTTSLEDVTIDSRWRADGAGRADITIANGDVPPPTIVTAVECWNTDFLRSYYSDSVTFEPTEGQASSCAYSGSSD